MTSRTICKPVHNVLEINIIGHKILIEINYYFADIYTWKVTHTY